MPDHVLDRMNDAMDAPRPERPRHARVPWCLDRRAAPEHRRRRGRPPAVLERGRRRSGRPRTASSTTTSRSATTCGADGHAFREPLRHRDPAAPVRGVRADVRRSSCAGCSAVAVWDRLRRRGVIARDRLGDQAALLRRLRRLARLRVRAQEPARQRARPDRSRLRGDRRVPLARVLPGAGDTARRREEARARLHPRDRGRRRRGAAVLELPASRRWSAAAASRSGASACSRSSRSRCACG